MEPVPVLFTIGHSSHPLKDFLALLERYRVEVVCDVRSHPASRRSPHFGRWSLERSLARNSIEYVFLGRELGARSNDTTVYRQVTSRQIQVQFDLLARTDLFQRGLDRVRSLVAERRAALMCAESDPLTCHRTILVGRALAEGSMRIAHIRADGSLETHPEARARLIDECGLRSVQRELFAPPVDREAEAYHMRGRRIAYRKSLPP